MKRRATFDLVVNLRRRSDRVSAPGNAGAILPVKVRAK
jgi:hypothetical protein